MLTDALSFARSLSRGLLSNWMPRCPRLLEPLATPLFRLTGQILLFTHMDAQTRRLPSSPAFDRDPIAMFPFPACQCFGPRPRSESRTRHEHAIRSLDLPKQCAKATSSPPDEVDTTYKLLIESLRVTITTTHFEWLREHSWPSSFPPTLLQPIYPHRCLSAKHIMYFLVL